MLEVLTIAPPPFRRMSAASAVMAVQCARKFTANCWSMSSSLVVSSGPGCWIAAPLLNAPSSLPCSSSTRSTAARMLARSARSMVTASATPPSARTSVTIAVEGVGAAGGEHDGGALAGEEPGRGRPDAAAGAGDEHNLAGEQADRCDVDVVGHANSVRPEKATMPS